MTKEVAGEEVEVEEVVEVMTTEEEAAMMIEGVVGASRREVSWCCLIFPSQAKLQHCRRLQRGQAWRSRGIWWRWWRWRWGL